MVNKTSVKKVFANTVPYLIFKAYENLWTNVPWIISQAAVERSPRTQNPWKVHMKQDTSTLVLSNQYAVFLWNTFGKNLSIGLLVEC